MPGMDDHHGTSDMGGDPLNTNYYYDEGNGVI